MLFNSLEFLFIFLPITFLGYFLFAKLEKHTLAKIWLVIASLYFYAYYKIEYLPIIVSSIIFNYTIGLLFQKNILKTQSVKKLCLFLSLIANLGLLSYYKYFDFLIRCLNHVFDSGFNTMHLLLPLGISFFTFQQISFLVDSYKGEVKYTNLLDYTLFVVFFPQLVAGPIVMHKDLIPQIQDNTKRHINFTNLSAGFFFITIGLVKKVLLADSFTPFIQSTIANLSNISFFNSWFLALSIGSQGYFDFSGYCDIAMGLGLLFNINLPINFYAPYQSIDISEFWRRWHITMGTFLKYNVYIPLGGSRAGTFNTYRNLFFVFLITGIWHGANWPCILYGIINGILVCLNKYWKTLKIEMNKHLAVLITFITMIFISPLVSIKTLPQCIKVFTSMLGINTHFNFFYIGTFNLCLIILSLFLILGVKNSNELVKDYQNSKSVFVPIYVALLFIFAVLSLTGDISGSSEFIYFQF